MASIHMGHFVRQWTSHYDEREGEHHICIITDKSSLYSEYCPWLLKDHLNGLLCHYNFLVYFSIADHPEKKYSQILTHSDPAYFHSQFHPNQLVACAGIQGKRMYLQVHEDVGWAQLFLGMIGCMFFMFGAISLGIE